MSETPYIGFSNETLDKLPSVKAGDRIECTQCGQEHALIPPDDWEKGDKESIILFYCCNGNSFLGAVNGKLTSQTFLILFRKKIMQTIRLHLDHFNFFCPVTGEHILGSDEFKVSPATEFVFSLNDSMFEHAESKYEKIWDDLQEKENQLFEDDSDEDFDCWEEFKKTIKDNSIIVFEITTSGMACGPVSSTVCIGINMNYIPEEQLSLSKG
jgi:hypothetical protein|tara:strand:+ start:3117 stop:3752 length:636 start_codon:yes stop_codon:yes gene_type:complete